MDVVDRYRERRYNRLLNRVYREDVERNGVGVPDGNRNAAKDYVSQIVKNTVKKFPSIKTSAYVGGIPKSDYNRVVSKINSDYPFKEENSDGRIACHWIADRGGKLNEGHMVFFRDCGRMNSEPLFRIKVTNINKDFLENIAEEMDR